MPDAPVFLLFQQVFIDSVLAVQIRIDIHLAYIVEQIEVKITDAAFFQLSLENFFCFRHICKIVSRKLGCQIKALPGIFLQNLSHGRLGISPVISPCCVKIINPSADGIFHHLSCRRLIYYPVIVTDNREPHASQAKRRQF